MYYYVIDPQTTSPKNFERVQNQLYSCLSEMRISGEIARVTSLRNVAQLVEAGIMSGATTIVAVGDDGTFEDLVAAANNKNVVIGYIPITDSEVGKIIGANDVQSACQNLAQRRIEQLDLGEVQGNSFFTSVSLGADINSIKPESVFNFSRFKDIAALQPVPISLEIDDMFTARFEVAIGLVVNSRAGGYGNNGLANPTDHMLDILMLPKLSAYDAWKYRAQLATGHLENIPGCAVIRGGKIKISGPADWPLYVRDKVIAKSQAVIEAVPNKIKMIVGRSRTF